jgi:hypothetical protein
VTLPQSDAKEFCLQALKDATDLRREILHMHRYLTENYGYIVDLNFDYMPDFITVTFQQALDAQRALSSTPMSYVKSTGGTWSLTFSRVTFSLPIRNCALADDLPPNKYLPIWANRERAIKAKPYIQLE